MSKIKNIIFDLGGVIINLDVPKTIHSFENLGFTDFQSIYTQLQQLPLFDQFDKGNIAPEDFFERIKKIAPVNLKDAEIIAAWNAMLLDFPKHRMDLLLNVTSKYKTFLLSNTNETHIEAFEASLYKEHGVKNLQPFFHRVYYSCRMGMRKPDEEIFLKVLNENGLFAEETVFIDDTPQHVNGALKCGIKAFLLHKNREVESLLSELNLL